MKRILLLSIVVLLAGTAQANENNVPVYDNKGFYLNLTGMLPYFSFDEADEKDSGYGGGVRLGFNFSPNFGIFLSADGSVMEVDVDDNEWEMMEEEGDADYALVHVDIGAQLTLGNIESRFRPYARASYLVVQLSDDYMDLKGDGYSVGGGVLLFISSSVALDVNYTHSWINIDEFEMSGYTQEVDIDATSQRIMGGLTFFF
ncbi:outer membrane beta-barrel protein [Balneolaceae bacterium ANBcel3]|nr:outer membrane beta-barrel protein [Balneolaceae bacterium ANBcel3]